jgi:hypothetical protein
MHARWWIFLFLLMLSGTLLHAATDRIAIPSSGSDVKDFVPKGFQITNKLEADFNGDGVGDIILVIGSENDSESSRPLIILFGKIGGGYVLSARADDIMEGSGGVHSGPYGDIEIRKNTFVVTQFTGSTRVQDSSHSQFQFKKGGWYLIGQKVTASLSGGSYREWGGLKVSGDEEIVGYSIDKNFLTGYQEKSWSIFNSKTEKDRSIVKRTKTKRTPLIQLEKFNNWTEY